MAEPVFLPVEIWCQIFSYLDQSSIRNVSATCTLFFGIVRGDEKLSGHVILKQINLRQLLTKIKSAEWTWERWPCLKTLEIPIQHQYPKHGLAFFSEFDIIPMPITELKLEQCPSLDKLLIFNCAFRLSFDTSDLCHGFARKLCLNPSAIPSSFTWENWTHLEMTQLKNVNRQTLKQLGEKATQIDRLSIEIESNFFSRDLLEHGFTPMLKEWKNSLTTFEFTLTCENYYYNNVLKAVSENCINLENLFIRDQNAMFRKVNFAEYSFPKLKELIVPKLQNISSFIKFNNAKNLTNLKVDFVTNTLEFFSFDFSNIFMKLKHLQKCEIFVRTIICQQYDWAKIIDDNFQPMTKVVVYQLFNFLTGDPVFEDVFIKPPYEKTRIVIDSRLKHLPT